MNVCRGDPCTGCPGIYYQANYYAAEKKAFWKLIKNLSAFHVAGL